MGCQIPSTHAWNGQTVQVSLKSETRVPADHAGRSELLPPSLTDSASTPTVQSPSLTPPSTCSRVAKHVGAAAVTPVKPGTFWSRMASVPAASTKEPVANLTASHLVNITPKATEQTAPNGTLTLQGALLSVSEVTN